MEHSACVLFWRFREPGAIAGSGGPIHRPACRREHGATDARRPTSSQTEGPLRPTLSAFPERLFIEQNQIRFVREKTTVVTIPTSAVTEISYGQDVHRRIGAAIGLGVVTLGVGALMALTKSKKHFVGLTWANGDKKGGLAMQCDKNDYRGVLTGLEGVTGKKAVDSATLTVRN